MARHERFEWDADKAAANLRKHGVSFEAAARVLADPFGELFQLERYDDRHGEAEARWITVGSLPTNRSIILLIVWTTRPGEEGDLKRLISARRVTPAERNHYEQTLRR